MKIKFLYTFLSEFFFIVIIKSKSYDGYTVYELKPNNDEDLHKFFTTVRNKQGISVWHTRHPTDIMVSPDIKNQFVDMVQKQKVNYTVKIEDISRTVPRTTRKSLNHFKWAKSMAASITFDRYYDHEMITDYLDSLPPKYSQFVELINIGKSFEGRDMKILRITSPLTTIANSTKPAIFFDGGIHAREWIAPAQVLFIIHNLLTHHEQYFELIRNLDWYLLPVVNPDGYDFSFIDDRYWRKTRSHNGSVNNSFCVGVDANRNWQFHFHEDIRTRDSCSENYGGPAPFSENETRNIKNFVQTIKDRLKLYVTFHSYGPAILYPWAYTNQEEPDNVDELRQLAEAVKKVLKRRYKVGPTSKVQYVGAGQSQDWFKGVLGVPLCYTIELPGGGEGGFDLPEDEIQSVVSDMFEGVKIFAEYVYNNYPPNR